MNSSEAMTPLELRASIGLASIFGLRMLGMFVILPVFALYAERLPGGDDHTLIGIAIGIYGLTQAMLQLPFGWLSDRYGRKRILYIGLVILAAGSFVAALANDVYLIILGRALQGAGAISATAIALVADLTREEHRTKAMALIGSTIGATFALSLVMSPALNSVFGVPGIFAMTGFLALIAMAVVYGVVPDPRASHFHSDAEAKPGQFLEVLRNPELARLNYGIFALHVVLMTLFVIVPFALRGNGLAVDHHWQVYLPVMLASFVVMMPAIIYAEKKAKLKQVFIAAVAVLGVAQAALAWWINSLWGITVALLVFFSAFNILEAKLPSLISRIAPAKSKGTAIGVFSSLQFFGTFVGAALGGFLSEHSGTNAVFACCIAFTLVWMAVAANMQAPQQVQSKMFHIPEMEQKRALELTRSLLGLQGVKEAVLVPEEGVAYLKVSMESWDEQGVVKLIGGEA